MVNRIVSTKFKIVIAHLSLYSVILHHPVTGSIIVTYLSFKKIFLFMKYLPIKYSRSVFQGVSSASLAGNLSFFYLMILYVGKYHNY